MSRNRDIENLHQVTGLKYSALRKELKANGWDYWRTYHKIQNGLAYSFYKFIDALDDAFTPILKELTEITRILAEALKND